jgi:hypothetical protein
MPCRRCAQVLAEPQATVQPLAQHATVAKQAASCKARQLAAIAAEATGTTRYRPPAIYWATSREDALAQHVADANNLIPELTHDHSEGEPDVPRPMVRARPRSVN